MFKYSLVFLLLLLILTLIYPRFVDRYKDYKCPGSNVILISIDTLRADHLRIYGYKKDTSPNIDKFAYTGIVFENFFSQSNNTLLSHISLMTSLYPYAHGVMDRDRKLPDFKKTIAEVLKKNGYATAAFTGGFRVSKKYGFDHGFDIYKEEYNSKSKDSGQGVRLENLEKDLFSWLDKHSNKKFFLFIHSYDTHMPYIAHDYLSEFEKSYSGRLNILNNHSVFVNSQEFKIYSNLTKGSLNNINDFLEQIINKNLVELTNADVEHILALYDNEVRFMDNYFEKLKELNLMGKTLVILTSDHGDELYERGKVGHGHTLYDEITKVPLLIYIPNYKTSSVRSKKLAQSIDIAPTILDILNIKPENDFQGISLLPLSNIGNSFVASQNKILSSLRTKEMKIIYNSENGNLELFDLINDPHELNNIAESEPNTINKMKKDLFDTLNMVERDEVHLKQLKSLGYIN
jgi:arylsulfatase A-like enzyme